MSLQNETIEKIRKAVGAFPKFSDEERREWIGYVELFPPEYALFIPDLFENPSPRRYSMAAQKYKGKTKN